MPGTIGRISIPGSPTGRHKSLRKGASWTVFGPLAWYHGPSPRPKWVSFSALWSEWAVVSGFDLEGGYSDHYYVPLLGRLYRRCRGNPR